ncbi:type III pantothenate kinase [Pedobacter nototheniae]|uniref:type III pantothenate kinase n=1 Tax=Pedobacter nototheniae TaxID=2488994 RepID=UPI0029313FAF|nr:type III pantothenate kinase [Pedobacter nototheniae]
MHKLCIDIGNSAAKIAVFAGLEIVDHQRIEKLGVADLAGLIKEFSPEKAIISSVSEEIGALELFLQHHTQYTRFSTVLSNGVANKYKTPATLGLDRWAVVLGANGLFPDKASLVIDAGTCITYDILTHAKEYYGGSISPGIEMRFKAMHTFTRRLPLVEWDAEAAIPEGNDTQTAMLNGVLQGVINEIEGFIAINNKKESTLQVILTGGDANFLYKQLQNSIFAPQIITDPFLVLKGLNEAIAD